MSWEEQEDGKEKFPHSVTRVQFSKGALRGCRTALELSQPGGIYLLFHHLSLVECCFCGHYLLTFQLLCAQANRLLPQDKTRSSGVKGL